MKHIAIWKRLEQVENSFGSLISSFESKGELQGYLDTTTIATDSKANRYLDTSSFIFITHKIVPIIIGDILEINNKEYKVVTVDNPMFMDSHLEIGLENNN